MFGLTLLTRLFNEPGMRLQRQGRIGFFAPSTGQEVAQAASAFAYLERARPSYWPSAGRRTVSARAGVAAQHP